MDVSIIIVNYNTKSLLENCIQSIYQYTSNIEFEIIVVDNNSQDGSQEMLRNSFPGIILIEMNKNVGFGRANNIGARNAKGKFLFLLNSDTVFIENSLPRFLEFYHSSNYKTTGVIGGKLLDANHKINVSYGNFPSLAQEVFEYGFSKIFKKYYQNKLSPSVYGNRTTPIEVDYLMGADMFLEKNLFNTIGGFDEDFFLYYEETELCYRIKKAGYVNYWIPSTQIIHYWGASSQSDKKTNTVVVENLVKSKILFYKKCYGPYKTFWVKLISIPKFIHQFEGYTVTTLLKLTFKKY